MNHSKIDARESRIERKNLKVKNKRNRANFESYNTDVTKRMSQIQNPASMEIAKKMGSKKINLFQKSIISQLFMTEKISSMASDYKMAHTAFVTLA